MKFHIDINNIDTNITHYIKTNTKFKNNIKISFLIDFNNIHIGFNNIHIDFNK